MFHQNYWLDVHDILLKCLDIFYSGVKEIIINVRSIPNNSDEHSWLNYYQDKFPSLIYNECLKFIIDAHLYNIIF